MISRSIARADAALGAVVEAGVRRHHARRLRRLGQQRALDPGDDGSWWASGDPPPRPGCAMEVLIDGAEALPAIVEAVGRAKRWVHVAGWHVQPGFRLGQDGPTVRDLLAAAAARGVDVRVLVWA